MNSLIDKLSIEGRLSTQEYRSLLACADDDAVREYAASRARETALARFGNGIYIRGLIEVSNVCRNDCYYCGIRRSNRNVSRYSLSYEEIMECCRTGYALGFRTFVMQGGEISGAADEAITDTVRAVRAEFPDCAITLSLGEKRREVYQRFFDAGANRYLLRHETVTPDHYGRLHPAEMSLEGRLHCLYDLREIGFQTGTGIMVGSPYQTLDNIVADVLFIEKFRPQMIGLGPYLPQHDTPFAAFPAGSMNMTLMLLSVFRLMFPDALIPSTTALATIAPQGRELGILAGANVVMPNLSPADTRAHYALYDNKRATGTEAAEGLRALEAQLESIGYRISFDRGDYSPSGGVRPAGG